VFAGRELLHVLVAKDKKLLVLEDSVVCVKTKPSRRLNAIIVPQERSFHNAQAQLEKILQYVEQAADSGERIGRVDW